MQLSARFTSRRLLSASFKLWLNRNKWCSGGGKLASIAVAILKLICMQAANGGVQARGDGGQFTVTGEYMEIDSPRLLVYSWVASWTGDVKTTVRWELEPVNNGTLVRIRHSGLAAHPEVAQSYRGWPRMLGWLQAYIEKGETTLACASRTVV